MKILVLGSGVIGVTTAWYLHEAGHDVTVVDRQLAPGMETSFANGGQISWSSAAPWAAPDIPLTVLKWLIRPHSPLVLRPRIDPRMWEWLFRMLRNCTAQRFARNRGRMLRLARYSHECLVELRNRIGIDYDQSARGLLALHRDRRGFEEAKRSSEALRRLDIPIQVLDSAGCVALEPALGQAREKIVGGLHFPGDEAGDCHKFTVALAERAKEGGVQFVTSTTVECLAASGERVERIVTKTGELSADMYVLACGSYTPLLLRPIGIRLPVYPVKGYSMTLTSARSALLPRGTLSDETFKIVITRLGERLRVAGTAELAGYDLKLRPFRFATLEHAVRGLFPGVMDGARVEYWCGLRPMTPDNPPVLGRTRYRNLMLNTGHGTLGWTMACGSAAALSALISGREPKVPLEDYSIDRFG
ncbi:MAG TPA: D-amino acid dehydrogenase [Burkholderiales bacterium]|nr:D-amino acid dehydrogenase [Burkholderiales bacterium]